MKTKIWVVSFRKKSTKLKIRMYDCIPPTDEFDYLRPDGCIFVSIDRRYKVPLFDLRFDGWYENSVRLWPNHIEQNDCVLSLDNPLVIDTSVAVAIFLMILVLIPFTGKKINIFGFF